MTLPTRARVDDGLRACRHRFGASVVSLAVSNGFGTIAKVEYSAGGTDEFMLPDPHGAVWVEPSADQKAGSSKPSAAGSAAQHASGQGGDGLSSDDDELGSMIDESSSSFTVGVPKRKRKRKRREHAADLPDGDVWVQVSPSPIRAPPPPPAFPHAIPDPRQSSPRATARSVTDAKNGEDCNLAWPRTRCQIVGAVRRTNGTRAMHRAGPCVPPMCVPAFIADIGRTRVAQRPGGGL